MKHRFLVLISICFTLTFGLNAFSFNSSCMSLDTAKSKMYREFNLILRVVSERYDVCEECSNNNDSDREDEDYQECVSEKDIFDTIKDLEWDHEKQTFVAPYFISYNCAPGADCWSWIEMTCDGEYILEFGGEE